jgi:hypothetical protein
MKTETVWVITYNFDGNVSVEVAASREVAHGLIRKVLSGLIKDGSYTGETVESLNDCCFWNDIDYAIDRLPEWTDYADRIFCEEKSVQTESAVTNVS